MADPVVYESQAVVSITLGAGLTCVAGELLAHDGSAWVKADADPATPLPADVITVEAQQTAAGVVKVAKRAVIYDSDAPYTLDTLQYLSGTAGAITETDPTTSDATAERQIVGRAISTSIIVIDLNEQSREQRSLVTWCFNVNLNHIDADGDVITGLVPGYRGKVVGFQAFLTDTCTTTGDSTTLYLEINGTNITGGELVLFSDSLITHGMKTDAAAMTAGQDFIATNSIDIEASGTTRFAEGRVTIVITALVENQTFNA